MSHEQAGPRDVRVWGIRKYAGRRGATYNVRWRVGANAHSRTLSTRKLAEAFHASLITASRGGEPFNWQTGMPRSQEERAAPHTWLAVATAFMDMKWPHASPRHRKGLAEALTQASLLLTRPGGDPPAPDELRRALYQWAFNTAARAGPLDTAAPPDALAQPIGWIKRRSLPVTALTEPTTLRGVLAGLATRQDGRPAAAATTARKRSALFSVLDFAVEQGHLTKNPMEQLRVRTPRQLTTVDERTVVNRRQAVALLEAVAAAYPELEAFFACIYYAALRPGEVRHLRRTDCDLPTAGWGTLTLTGSTQNAGSSWSDSGRVDDDRALKHRAAADYRKVPAHPDLVAILRAHLRRYDCGPDGRLFVTRTGPMGRPLPAPFSRPVSMNTVYRAWGMARRAALTDDVYAGPLARRPYDLRHACVSTWLNAGVPATQVAEWAGHSVNVLLRVYAKVVSGQEDLAKRKIEQALESQA
ncbi:MAG TPA: tyrosine-type recombinase/integrase [Dermatophilaceae bacterium]|nr:tyrosine-type recombinase/integrase [Dermatophilaceae bacterium]